MNSHGKLVEFCWVDKTLIPSVPSSISSTISYNIYILLHCRAKYVFGTRPSTWSTLWVLIVIWVERSCCVFHEKCICFFFEHILHFRGSSYLASRDSMMPFASLCVCVCVCDNYNWRTICAFCIIILSPPQVLRDAPFHSRVLDTDQVWK